MRRLSLDATRMKQCVVCGEDLDEDHTLVCSRECSAQFRTTKYLGRYTELDAFKEQDKYSRFSQSVTLHGTITRTCPDCGQRHTSTKFDKCENCRYEEQAEQKLYNKEIMKGRKKPPPPPDPIKQRIERLAIETMNRTEEPMQELYNCKQIDRTHYRITKFDKHLDPRYSPKGEASSYIVSTEGCDCPQGNKPTCRHRKMLPLFAAGGYVDTEYFFVWDTHQWYKPTGIFAQARTEGCSLNEPTTDIASYALLPDAYELMSKDKEGGPKPASEAPSPQPSPKTYRRF